MVSFFQKVELVRRVDILRAGAERLSRVCAVLVEQRIDSISLNPDTVITTAMAILETAKGKQNQRRNENEEDNKLDHCCHGNRSGMCSLQSYCSAKLQSEPR
jgi:hypothetical protein